MAILGAADRSQLAFPDSGETLAEVLSGVELDQQQGLVGQIYSALWDAIVSVRIKPGRIISESELGEAFKASKTPVREALIRLENAGLVEIIPKSGTYVTPIRIERYIESCFVRLQLESGAVRRAAQRNHDVARLVQLEAILQRQIAAVEADDYERFFNLDQSLHESFFEMAGISGVWDVVKRSQGDVNRIRHLKRIYNIKRGPLVIAQHKAIVAAIRAGEPDAAEAALRDHLGSLEREIDELAAHPDLLAFIETLNTSHARFRGARRS
ncbi:MAG: GntR family transcriptional regulator [Devosia marina]|jgi:DNA-binding GntR family transcriptional regulator|uniref:GntR family transcriptional regulator n=1 Tax=Devosia marina TaxID=2683198 RepID=UPI0032EADCC4